MLRKVYMEQLLVVDQVLDLLQISRPTLDRYIRLARNGELAFPLPIQMGAKRKRLWNAQSIEDWASYRHKPSVMAVAVNTTKQSRKAAKDFNERQQRAAAILAKHGITNNSNQ
jgi:predicted DNA-binding transcriptional regulator AlpA